MGRIRDIQYDCRKATFLIEKRMIGRITFRETIELRIHLAGCSVCRLFEKQSRIINAMVKKLFIDTGNNKITLDDDYKQGLHARIEEELNEN
jgi:hypothetical protein